MNTQAPFVPRISIAMATYNGSKYLLEQLDSLAAQTLQPCELVVTDDGSTDDTLRILDEFAKRASFPVSTYRNEQRLGYRENFLKAARLCSGEFIAFCDQDDVWMPEKLMCVAQPFVDEEILLVLHDAFAVTEALETIMYIHTPENAMPFSVQFGFTMAFRADLPLNFNIIRPPCERDINGSTLAHDQWISFLASCLGKCRVIHKPLVLYRQHGSNTCGIGNGSNSVGRVNVTEHAEYLRLSHYAHARASTIQELIRSNTFSEKRQNKARASLAEWKRYATLLQLRAEINSSKTTFFVRQKHFFSALLLHGYGSKLLGRKAFCKDAFVALFGHDAFMKLSKVCLRRIPLS
jgi:hypothetical protein